MSILCQKCINIALRTLIVLNDLFIIRFFCYADPGINFLHERSPMTNSSRVIRVRGRFRSFKLIILLLYFYNCLFYLNRLHYIWGGYEMSVRWVWEWVSGECSLSDVWCLFSDLWYSVPVYCLVSVVWCLVSNIWCLVSNVPSMLWNVWGRNSILVCLMSNASCLITQVCCQIFYIWCLIYNDLCLISGI